jgi:preprotein translocase subunit YajC
LRNHCLRAGRLKADPSGCAHITVNRFGGTMSFIETAYAMAPQAGGGGEANMFASLMPFALIFLVFYFLLIRPQQKKAKEHKQMLAGLKKGDAVITAGGIFGRIVEVDGDIMTVDLGETRVTMGRGYLNVAPQIKQAAPPVKKEKKGKKDNAPKAAPVAAAAPETAEIADAPAETPAAPAEAQAEAAPAPAVSGNDDGDKPAVQ